MSRITHTNDKGKIQMVDVSKKEVTERIAVAKGIVIFSEGSYSLLRKAEIKKGDVLTTAKIAAIQGAKNTSTIIPLCHQIPLSHIDVEFEFDDENRKLTIKSIVRCFARTGAEMEALTAVAVAALTIYDMCKGADRNIVIKDIELCEKSGGKSGHYIKER